MSRQHDQSELERDALQRVATLPAPTPSASARERARAAFLTGTDPRRAMADRRRRADPRVVAAMAAGIALAVFGLGNRSPDHWRVVGVAAGEAVRLDDRTPEIATMFDEAHGRTGEDAKLDVQLGERVRVLVTPESEVTFPRGPGRWVDRSRVLRVEAGEICATTEGRRLGFDLVIDTPEAETHVLGTTFAVTRNELGTLVAVYEGKVDVIDKSDGKRHPVPPLGKVQIHADGSPPARMPLDDAEHTMLETMRSTGMAP